MSNKIYSFVVGFCCRFLHSSISSHFISNFTLRLQKIMLWKGHKTAYHFQKSIHISISSPRTSIFISRLQTQLMLWKGSKTAPHIHRSVHISISSHLPVCVKRPLLTLLYYSPISHHVCVRG